MQFLTFGNSIRQKNENRKGKQNQKHKKIKDKYIQRATKAKTIKSKRNAELKRKN
jgi:hypothetical protein